MAVPQWKTGNVIWSFEVSLKQIIKERRKKRMRKLAEILRGIIVTLTVGSVTGGLVWIGWATEVWLGIGILVFIVAIVIIIVLSIYLDSFNENEWKETPESEELPQCVLDDLAKLEEFEKQDEVDKLSEAAKVQKKENKEKVKQYVIKNGTLHTPDGNVLLFQVISVCKQRVVPEPTYSGHIRLKEKYVILVADLLPNKSIRTSHIEFDNADLRDMVFEKLFREKGELL